MAEVRPRPSQRPLLWPSSIVDLRALLADEETPVYIVGGAVRDAYRHYPVKDLDLATPGDAIKLGRRIANGLKGDFYILDAERGVARVLIDTSEGRLTLDVARLRGDDLLTDLFHRDFTLNALAVELKGDLTLLIDPLNGEQDLIDRVIRRCSSDAIVNDPIRSLRAVRQGVQLSARIEPATMHDIRNNGARLAQVSPERVRDEFVKLLALDRPAAALRVADTLGLLSVIVPEVQALQGARIGDHHLIDGWQHTLYVIEHLNTLLTAISPARTDHTAASFGMGMAVVQLNSYRAQLNEHIVKVWPNERPHRALLMLAALLHDCGRANPELVGRHDRATDRLGVNLAAARANALRLSNAERQRLTTIIRYQHRFQQMIEPTPVALHRFWQTLGAAGVDVCLLALADYLGMVGSEIDQDHWLELVDRTRILLDAYFEHFDQLVEPPLLLDGNQLMQALDLKPGAHIGRLLDRIREGQVAGEIHSVEDALHLARNHLTASDTPRPRPD